MKVFVAGATGVLGRATVKVLVEAGHSVRGTARGGAKAELLRSMGAEPLAVDLFDAMAVKDAVAGSEAVLHLATKIPPIMRMRWKGAWRENDRLRTEASRNLVDAALATGASVFVQESITFIYGDGGDSWLTEDSPVSITWFSLQSMVNGERETERFRAGGGRGVSLRYGAFYAANAQSTLDTIKLARRRMLAVPGDGSNYVSSIHVDDAAAAAVAALEVPGGVYNVVDDEPLRMRDYALATTTAFGLKASRRVPKWLFRLILGGPEKYLLGSQRVSNARFKEATRLADSLHSGQAGQAGWEPKYSSARGGWQAIAAEFSDRLAPAGAGT
jgi:nucleoside-diphosphate-sugar epimerase